MPSRKDKFNQVIDYLNNLDHPMKQEIEEVRNWIRHLPIPLIEHIKWNAPSFCYNNEDRITFNLHGKGYFQLIFHCGAKVKERIEVGRIIDDTSEILDWITNDRASVKFRDMNDVNSKKDKLAEVINKWITATT